MQGEKNRRWAVSLYPVQNPRPPALCNLLRSVWTAKDASRRTKGGACAHTTARCGLHRVHIRFGTSLHSTLHWGAPTIQLPFWIDDAQCRASSLRASIDCDSAVQRGSADEPVCAPQHSLTVCARSSLVPFVYPGVVYISRTVGQLDPSVCVCVSSEGVLQCSDTDATSTQRCAPRLSLLLSLLEAAQSVTVSGCFARGLMPIWAMHACLRMYTSRVPRASGGVPGCWPCGSRLAHVL